MSLRWPMLVLSMIFVQTAQAAWLGICPAAPPGSTLLAVYSSPQRTSTALYVAEDPLQDCAAIELPFSSASIVSGRVISQRLLTALNPGFALTGRLAGQEFRISDVVPTVENAEMAVIPVGVELRDKLNVQAFGIEGRAVSSQHNGPISLECTAGHRAAGILLTMPFQGLPRAIPLSIKLEYVEDGTFEMGISDFRRTTLGDPLHLSKLPAAETTLSVAIPDRGLALDRVESFTITCPRQAAKFRLTSLKVQPKIERPVVASRALWVWQPDKWMQSPEALLNMAARVGVGMLYVNVPIELTERKVLHAQELEKFVTAANQRGVRVWAVVGDPGAVLESERETFSHYPIAYARYNSTVPGAARLAGIQFDIEPYLNAGYELDPAVWYEAYLETLRQLRAASTLPVDVAVPFWWADQQTVAGALMDRLVPVVDSITVMDYRTDPTEIRRFAQPFLEWGARHQRMVHIALESGPIPDEIQRHYLPSPSGEIALIQLGSYGVLLELDRTVSLPEPLPSVRTFHLSDATPAPGSATTFLGQKGELLKLLPELESLWSAWPSFAGAALHEFEP
jgi:hypothetical protein